MTSSTLDCTQDNSSLSTSAVSLHTCTKVTPFVIYFHFLWSEQINQLLRPYCLTLRWLPASRLVRHSSDLGGNEVQFAEDFVSCAPRTVVWSAAARGWRSPRVRSRGRCCRLTIATLLLEHPVFGAVGGLAGCLLFRNQHIIKRDSRE